MRWKKPNDGDTRIFRTFLFLPRTLNGETRWLEKARIKQRYWWNFNGWEDIAFVDEKEHD
jgi:hypothetical protein